MFHDKLVCIYNSGTQNMTLVGRGKNGQLNKADRICQKIIYTTWTCNYRETISALKRNLTGLDILSPKLLLSGGCLAHLT